MRAPQQRGQACGASRGPCFQAGRAIALLRACVLAVEAPVLVWGRRAGSARCEHCNGGRACRPPFTLCVGESVYTLLVHVACSSTVLERQLRRQYGTVCLHDKARATFPCHRVARAYGLGATFAFYDNSLEKIDKDLHRPSLCTKMKVFCILSNFNSFSIDF